MPFKLSETQSTVSIPANFNIDNSSAGRNCKNNKDAGGIDLLEEIVEYGIIEHGFEPDAWVFELVDAVIGDN